MIRMKTNNAKLGKSLRRAAGKTAALLLSFLLTVGSVPVYAVPDTDAAVGDRISRRGAAYRFGGGVTCLCKGLLA